jgi:hypothetical protein
MEELKNLMNRSMTEDEMLRQEATVTLDEDEDGKYFIFFLNFNFFLKNLKMIFHFQRKNILGKKIINQLNQDFIILSMHVRLFLLF